MEVFLTKQQTCLVRKKHQHHYTNALVWRLRHLIMPRQVCREHMFCSHCCEVFHNVLWHCNGILNTTHTDASREKLCRHRFEWTLYIYRGCSKDIFRPNMWSHEVQALENPSQENIKIRSETNSSRLTKSPLWQKWLVVIFCQVDKWLQLWLFHTDSVTLVQPFGLL